MNFKELPELDQLDRKTADNILQSFAEADYQIRRVRRNLKLRVQKIIANHREQIVQSVERPKELRSTKIKKPVDYDKLEAILHRGPITYDIIKRETGLNDGGVAEVITTLSLRYPLWDPAKGIYELLSQ
ncbi:hypothetical protein AGMMS50268_21310 [Spirochaetia bacterium]|nr:hypothetical protein AGMMS50268_21310 [Spirochaetia bacterium]